MTANEFETKLKALDPAFSVIPNPNRLGLSNIFYMNTNYDLPVIASDFIPDEPDQKRRYNFPNGYSARFWSVPEIMGRIEQFLLDYKSGKLRKEYE